MNPAYTDCNYETSLVQLSIDLRRVPVDMQRLRSGHISTENSKKSVELIGIPTMGTGAPRFLDRKTAMQLCPPLFVNHQTM